MTKKPTLFMVTDIETTFKHRIAFDVAWYTIDRKGKLYNSGSYVIREFFKLDVPFFKEKLGHYFDDAYANKIQPANIFEVREEYNGQLRDLRAKGHRVIPAAYNARFDFTELPKTLKKLGNDESLKWLDQPSELLDIWDYWGQSVPLNYQALPSNSQKFVSTSAESAFRWEFGQEDFVERHIAWHDCLIEADILQKALSRKKTMPLVTNPQHFAGAVWQKINNRLGWTGKDENHMPPQKPIIPKLPLGEHLLAA